MLYDVTSSYLEGRHCPLARRGYSRDGKKGKLQIVFGLICNAAGCPVAVEVFEGHCGDPATLSAQLDKLKRRFGLRRMVLVGEWGLITSARIDEELRPAGFDWMTALRAPAIAKLAGEEGPLQLSLFDQRGLAEIDSPDYPGERLIACRNPALAAERARKREELLAARDVELRRIQGRVRRARRPLRGAGEFDAVEPVVERGVRSRPGNEQEMAANRLDGLANRLAGIEIVADIDRFQPRQAGPMDYVDKLHKQKWPSIEPPNGPFLHRR